MAPTSYTYFPWNTARETNLGPWLFSLSQPSNQRLVINFSEQDCSGGDSVLPRPHSYCQQYYVCSDGKVIIVFYKEFKAQFICPSRGLRGGP